MASGCAQGPAPTAEPTLAQQLAAVEAAPLGATPDSDEFDDAATLGGWGLSAPGGATLAEAFALADVDGATPGALTVRPWHGAWYMGDRAAHLYREITGDFVVATAVSAGRVGAPELPPDTLYNDAGLLVRDPGAAAGEAWLAALIGQAGGATGTLAKTTEGGWTNVAFLPGGYAGELRICRVGSSFRALRRLAGEAGWTTIGAYERADLPPTLDVGLAVNAWQAPVSVEARFEYVRYATPAGLGDCEREIAAAPDAPPAAPTVLFDETFDDPAALSAWSLREAVEGDASHTDLVDVDGVSPGRLTLDPSAYSDPAQADGGAGPAWFQDRNGVFLFRELSGDFAVMTDLRVGTRDDIGAVPSGVFNSAGLLVRDPASFDPEQPTAQGGERWVVYNLGSQQGFVGTEAKTTFPGAAGSRSSLFLTPTGSAQGRLVICRVAGVFRFFRRLAGEAGWTEDVPSAGNLVYDGAGVGADPQALGFDRPDMANTVQVGLMVNRWADGGGSPVRADFDGVRAVVPASADDCLSAFDVP